MKSIRNAYLCLVVLVASPLAYTQTPELSADTPISYTADDGMLIATGNAVYEDENTRVVADEIRYDRIKGSIEASGNVQVTREGLRLLTHHLTYEAQSKVIQAGKFRAGYPPLFIEGESFSGTLDEIDFSKVTLYFREPVQDSPKLELSSGTYRSKESVTGEGLRLNVFGGLKLPLPAFEYSFGSPTADFDATLGFRNSLGAYIRTRTLYPLNRRLALGGNLDLFTRRGLLVGPAAAWQSEDGSLSASLDTGWIHDRDEEERGIDRLLQPIGEERGFASVAVRADRQGRFQGQLRATYLTDSELYRDFRRESYFAHFQPDNFIDLTWQGESLLINAFARRQINDHYGMIERLPELRAEWLPTAIGESGLYLQAAFGATRYRKVEVSNLPLPILFPDGPLGLPGITSPAGNGTPLVENSPYHNRLDGSFTLTRPFQGPMGSQLVLRAGARWTDYHQSGTSAPELSASQRTLGELGFDLSKTVARTYSINRSQWNMEQLRHISKWSLSYRWHPEDSPDAGYIPDIDDYVYIARRPVLDLSDIRHTDSLRDWNVLRVGWENQLLAAGEDGVFRDYLSLNLFQDIDLGAEPGADAWDALYAEVDYQPFPWLDLQWRQKIRTEQRANEAAYLRATLSSADLWTLTFQAEYLRGGIEQYDLEATYRLTETLGLLGYWHYDVPLGTLTRQQYGISRRFANVWQLEFYVAFNNENNREDDFSVGMRWLWLSF